MARATVIGVALAIAMLVTPPGRLQITSARGVTDIPLVRSTRDGPLLSLDALAAGVGGSIEREDIYLSLQTAAGRFRFLPGTPLVWDGVQLLGLPATSRVRGDSLMVPLAFVAEILASRKRQAWSYDAATGVLKEGGGMVPIANRPSTTTTGNELRTRWPGGVRPEHHVTIDPGHGGTDPGNPGMFFPHGLTEKDVTLAVGLLVRDELEKRGVRVTMTRRTDTLINLGQRAPKYCAADCDLFVSIHVNSLNPRAGYQQVRGFETYFLSEARDEDAARVARMENGAQRFDNGITETTPPNGLDFMFKDLARGEFLRGSQQAAAFIQSFLSEVHDGGNKGVKQAGFAVLSTARRPSVLIEMGYATNREDAALMTSRDGQRKLAANIAAAIMAYLKEHDKEVADTSTGTDP
jgi:N-acetylmuramoyl-L-alanine amidase